MKECEKNASYVYRKIIVVLIPDERDWAASNGSRKFIKKYPGEIGATFEFVNLKKSSFLMRDCMQLVNQLIAEARRSLKKIKLDATIDVQTCTDNSDEEESENEDENSSFEKVEASIPSSTQEVGKLVQRQTSDITLANINEIMREKVQQRVKESALENNTITSEDLVLKMYDDEDEDDEDDDDDGEN